MIYSTSNIYEYLKGDNCLFLGLSDIKETALAGLPAIEFNTSNVSVGAKHTLAAYKSKSGTIFLFDIFYTITGMSDEKDQTAEAYQSFLNTFEIRPE